MMIVMIWWCRTVFYLMLSHASFCKSRCKLVFKINTFSHQSACWIDQETWVKDSVLSLFPDTRDCSPSLITFFSGEKRAFGNRQNKRAPQTTPGINRRPLPAAIASDQRAFKELVSRTDSSRHLGPAVMQLAPSNLQGPLIAGETASGSNVGAQSVQLKRSLGVRQNSVWEIWLGPNNVVVKIILVTALGWIFFATFKLMDMQLSRMRSASTWGSNRMEKSSLTWTTDSSFDRNLGPACIEGTSIAGRLEKLLAMLKIKLRSRPEAVDVQKSCLAAGLSSSLPAVYKRPMPLEEAEALVKQWQAIKAEALGPNHQVYSLFEVLDESMLAQWHTLADAAKARSCFWRFVLLQLSVLRADFLSDGMGREIVEIEALLEEAAELVDESQQKNPNYYSTYKILYTLKRHDDGSWRFCEGDIQNSS